MPQSVLSLFLFIAVTFFSALSVQILISNFFGSPLTLSLIIIISIQPEGRLWQETESSQATGMALVKCILGSSLGVGCH